MVNDISCRDGNFEYPSPRDRALSPTVSCIPDTDMGDGYWVFPIRRRIHEMPEFPSLISRLAKPAIPHNSSSGHWTQALKCLTAFLNFSAKKTVRRILEPSTVDGPLSRNPGKMAPDTLLERYFHRMAVFGT